MTRPRDAQLPLLLTMSEGLSRGPDEMVPVSPNDSMHPPSCGLAIRDAVEEIKWLRAEVERLRAERDEAQSSCAYPDCVDLGPNGKCTKWLTGKCNPVLEAKP
jgi:hypothetical protein